MNKIKKILNKKGVISINYVIVVFICTILILGFISILNKTMSINEVQGVIDMAGVGALREGIDETQWRLEELVIDESLARNKFREMVYEVIPQTGAGLIRRFEIDEVNIYPPDSPYIKSLGITDGERDQYFLESIATATYRSEPIVDLVAFHAVNYFDFFRTNNYSSVMVSGTTNDGDVEVIIRSVTRLVYR